MKACFSMHRLSAAVLLGLAASTAQAGGLMLYETASDNTGLANAGAAARAQGPSTIASNIAGVANAAKSTTKGATETQRAAAELSRMAAQLQSIVGKYRL